MSANPSSLQDMYKTNVKLVYPFVEALITTLRVQCSVPAKMGKPVFKTDGLSDKVDVAISASITSNESTANVMLCFSQPVFLKIMGKMFGQIYSSVTPEIEDGAKELINIVFNQAKKPLADKGLAAVRSIPQIIFGHQMKIAYLSRGQTIALPIETDFGPISVEITTQDNSGSDNI